MTVNIDLTLLEQAAARIAPFILDTPLQLNYRLSEYLDIPVWVKWESLQLTGSFKLRGALNKLLVLQEKGLGRVLAVSAGNHGLGVAHAANMLNMEATIVVPKSAATTKVNAINRYKVELISYGNNYDEAELYARELANSRGVEFVSPYNDADIIAGQGTIALEMLELHDFDLLLAPVGGGGLLAGTAIAAQRSSYPIDVIGVQPANSTAMQTSFRAQKITNVTEEPTCADGLAGNLEADTVTFPIIRNLVSDILTVHEETIEHSIYQFLAHDHLVVEGSGAVGAAAIMEKQISHKYQRIGLIVTGRNVDIGRIKHLVTHYN